MLLLNKRYSNEDDHSHVNQFRFQYRVSRGSEYDLIENKFSYYHLFYSNKIIVYVANLHR